MPLICLVRHGQASFGADDYDVLSELGREQSRCAGEELRRRGLRDPLVVSGTLRRQRDTAALLAEAAGYPPAGEPDPRLDEYDHLDLLKRYPADDGEPVGGSGSRQVQRLLDGALRSWIAAGDADGWPTFSAGAAAAVADLAAGLERGRDAVVVSSGGVIAAVVAGLLGAGADGVVALNRAAVNVGVTSVLAGASGLSLLAFNDHAHVTGDRRHLLTYR
ncbi:histidine phosphatase family protein [Blastococcus sp. MG754426]|uniref:histidine phosphatase family protein n=1 Tax=unclassified Blastococcus TaxID=2619396 RepID=UPI001EEFAB85|nr:MULTISPECIES: histidine phosphatase family protein [unclassified Blastococcus]MCF6507422.1 histidine phosphatase family protein [Blastococcus sp. MG754426]MCF6512030.1 histidine phosphatase family protein [Blastococcus sp. MG754427]